MRGSLLGGTLGVALGAAAMFAPACASFGTVDETPDAAPDVVTEAGTDGSRPLTCSIVHVSVSKGDDANDGCSREKPLKTLARALADAPDGARVYVCAGVYREPQLTLQRRLSLFGGFNCATWEHGQGYGHAGGFKDVNLTRIENGAYASTPVTFAVRGAAVTSESIIEGFTFAASEQGALGGVGLSIADKAAPLVRDVEIVGGATTSGTGAGSVGLFVTGDAAPEVKDSKISGGTGTSSVTVGSVGVRITNASMYLHDNVVDGGAGTGAHGASGIIIDSAATGRTTRIARNTITWGSATAIVANNRVAAGIHAISDDAVSIEQNLVRSAVSGTCAMNNCVTAGIVLAGKNKVVSNNRIQPSDMRSAGGGLASYGVSIGQAEGAVVTGNVIHLSGRTNSNTYLEGVFVSATKGATIAGNTIVVGLGSTNPNRIAIRARDSSDVTADGNIFVGNAPTAGGWDTGLSGCKDNYTSIRSNLFVTTKHSYYALPGCAVPTPHAATVADFETAFGAVASGNKTLAPGCANASCVAMTCATEAACWNMLFPSFDGAGFGASNLTTEKGFALAGGGSCGVARGWATPPVAPTLGTDLYAVPRTPPFSIGAAEYDGVCVP